MTKRIWITALVSLTLFTVSCKNENKTENTKSNNDTIQQPSTAVGSKEVFNQDVDTVKRSVPADGKYPVMTFKETEFNFGDIEQGDKVEHTFEFKNTGEADLIIADAKASCGCTVPEYPKNKLIKSGESGKIKVTFDSARKVGKTSKTVTIVCNTEKGNELLTINTIIKVSK